MYPNVDVLKNNSLIIKNVTVKDAGDYYCEVLPEKVRMHALVEVDESLMIFCDGQEVTNRSLVFRQGEPHHCECKYYSLENVQIKWFIDVSASLAYSSYIFQAYFFFISHTKRASAPKA